jgi:hypothetical protein
MHERNVAAVSRRVERGCRFGEVLSQDADVAHLSIAQPELEMGEADRARIVRELGLLERPGMQGDCTRLLAASHCNASVQAPQRGETRGRNVLAKRIRCSAERRSGLRQVILEQPRLGETGADRKLVLARERAGAQHG